MNPRCPIVSLLLPLAATAQTLVVGPAPSAQFADLQAAIDAAPRGATIRVIGGTHGPLTIRRSVRIVCNPPAAIAAPFQGSGRQPAAITLLGGGDDVAVLAGFDVAGTADGSAWNVVGPALEGSGFSLLRIYDSRLEGHRWVNATGVAQGAAAIEVQGAARILLERCTVAGSRSIVDSSNVWVPPGSAGVDARDATVVALDSDVRGGDCGPCNFDWQPAPAPCPCPGGFGVGGIGIACRHGFVAGSTVSGGTGSLVLWQWQPWGQQPAGPAFVARSWTQHAATLAQATPLRLGAIQQLTFAPTTVPALLATGLPLVPGATLGEVPHVMIDPRFGSDTRFVPVGATAFSLAVPNVAGLLGTEIAQQRFDLAAFGVVATNAVLGVVAQ